LEIGHIGAAVADKVMKLREAQRFTYAELSRKLSGLGRDIPPLGLRRIETRERRIDVDDLVALANALGVAPTELLLDEMITMQSVITVRI
jgi:transcriptional regulator with XRE-family HTH domain